MENVPESETSETDPIVETGAGVALAEIFAVVRVSRVWKGLVAGVPAIRPVGSASAFMSAFASAFVSGFRANLLGRTGAEDMLPVELARTGLRVVNIDVLGLFMIRVNFLVLLLL